MSQNPDEAHGGSALIAGVKWLILCRFIDAEKTDKRLLCCLSLFVQFIEKCRNVPDAETKELPYINYNDKCLNVSLAQLLHVNWI